jgi:hypothetical protein
VFGTCPFLHKLTRVRREPIVRFVDIGGIADHDCLKFLFIIVGLVTFLLGLIKFYPTRIFDFLLEQALKQFLIIT